MKNCTVKCWEKYKSGRNCEGRKERDSERGETNNEHQKLKQRVIIKD